jgi:hypothetical protein
MTFYHTPAATAADLNPAPIVYDTFTAVKKRSDGFGFGNRRSAAKQHAGA